MSTMVNIATFGPPSAPMPAGLSPQAWVDLMLDFWSGKLARVLPDKPDLIVVPECCDIPEAISGEQMRCYLPVRQNQIRDLFAKTAKDHRCYIAYASARLNAQGQAYNSCVILDRQGQVAGTYNKNHPTIDEMEDHGILVGQSSPIIECDFGKVGCLICFDLNFDVLREQYARAKPDLLIFSSMYHGSEVLQSYWAYACRSYFVSAVVGLPSQIRNPYGQVMAASTDHRDHVAARVNLDYCLAHYDFNWDKLVALKDQFADLVHIHDPGQWGSVLITSLSPDISAIEMAKAADIELLDAFLARSLSKQIAQRQASVEV